jgi:hypothetical protein
VELADGPKRPSASQSDPSGIVEAAGVLAQQLGGLEVRSKNGGSSMRARYTSLKQGTFGPFLVVPIRAIIAIVACPSYGSHRTRTYLTVPGPFAVVSPSRRERRPISIIRANNPGGTRVRIKIIRPYPDAVQGANKHNGSYIFSHGSIGFLVFSSFVIG